MQLWLFGAPRLETEAEEPIRGRAAHRRRLAVLAMLAAARTKGVTRERLVATLWPDDDTERGRRQLSEALYLLRKEIGDSAIVGGGETLMLDHALVVSDVGSFREALDQGRLARAVDLYTAPFLDAWYVDGAPDFERWVGETRELLATELRTALESLASEAENKGAWHEAATWMGRLAREAPHSEPVVLRLSEALEKAGERAASLRALTAHIERLRDDLDIEPSQRVVDRISALRAFAPVLSESTRADPARERYFSQKTTGANHADRQPPLTRDFALNQWRIGGLVILVALVVAAVASVAHWKLKSAPSGDSPRGYDPRHVAVMYFDDHSEGRQLGHIADGITEELIHQLAQVSALRVVSRNGVKRFRNDPATPDSLAALLKVGSLVEGSVQQSGDSLRVTIQLIDANNGLHVESRTFERTRDELFAMEIEIAAMVAASLRRRLGETFAMQTLEHGTKSIDALDLVRRARGLRGDAMRIALHPHENDALSAHTTLMRADSLLLLAISKDEGWDVPLLERGWISLQRARFVQDSVLLKVIELAASLADELVRRDSNNAEALHLRGTARWRLASHRMTEPADGPAARDAERDLRAALAIDSTLAQGWATLADILNVRGALGEAVQAAERAIAQDAWLDGAEETYFMGFAATLLLEQYAEALKWCRRGQLAFPESWRFYECELTVLREDHATQPDTQRAWSLVARLDSLDPPAKAQAAGHAYLPLYRRAVAAAVSARAGDSARARSEIQALRSRVAHDSILTLDLHYEEAYVRYLLGEHEHASRLLDRLFRARPMLRSQMERDALVRWLRR